MFELRPCCEDRENDPHPPSYLNVVGKPPVAMSGKIAALVQSAPDRKESTAIHEAGHTIAAIRLGVTVMSATVEGQSNVHVVQHSDTHAAMVISLAGPAAEAWDRRWTIREYEAHILDRLTTIRRMGGGACDLCQAIRNGILATKWGDDTEVMTAFRRAEEEAIALVQAPENWRAICAVADALMKSGTLSGDEIIKIIENTP